MVIRNRKQPEVPLYRQRWEGKRIKWHGPEGWGSGLVLEADLHELEGTKTILLRVLRDDGFIQPGVHVDHVRESTDGGL